MDYINLEFFGFVSNIDGNSRLLPLLANRFGYTLFIGVGQWLDFDSHLNGCVFYHDLGFYCLI